MSPLKSDLPVAAAAAAAAAAAPEPQVAQRLGTQPTFPIQRSQRYAGMLYSRQRDHVDALRYGWCSHLHGGTLRARCFFNFPSTQVGPMAAC